MRKWLWVAVAGAIVVAAIAVAQSVVYPARAAGGIAASGTIEAEEYRVSAQFGGRVEQITVDEGDEVSAGQVLVKLDEALLRAELKKGEAGRAAAQAGLALVKAGARPEDLRKAEAGVLAARAARDGAKVAWEDANLARDNPQEMDLRIAAARAQLSAAEARLLQATAGTGAAQAQYDLWATISGMMAGTQRVCVDVPGVGEVCQDVKVPRQYSDDASYAWNQAAQQLAGAWDAVTLARAGRDAAETNLNSLLSQRANPLAANAQVEAALSQYNALEAVVADAEAGLAMARSGATPEQVASAQATVSQADAGVRALQVQLDKFTLRAPASGMVTARSVEEGEMALPGASLLTIANLDQVNLTLYIPESQVARVKAGQKVLVEVDSFPGRKFEGAVSYISPQAEYTPRAVQTQEERVKTVFAIKVVIENRSHELKPGMPADAEIQEGM